PHQLAARGDRLAFSNGIVALSLVAIVLVWLFHGDTSALIPLYAIGVFLCFTLSQAGMVKHWFSARGEGWWWRATLNGLGALATALVFLVQIATKFVHGAWIVVLIIPLIIWMLVAIHRHYVRFAEEIKYTGQAPLMFMHHTVVIPVSSITKATAGALVYATTISEDVRAVTVGVDPAGAEALRKQWEAWDIDVPLVVLDSPYRSVIRPIVDYVKGLEARDEADLVTVIVPEIVPHHWWEHLLHNKTALYIRTALMFRPKVVVTSVPYLLGYAVRLQDLAFREEPVPEPAHRAL
ncbi:MAG: hypothetical protein B7Z72_02575, partial [Gemmatimonadetes bacterium 21-71-4]